MSARPDIALGLLFAAAITAASPAWAEEALKLEVGAVRVVETPTPIVRIVIDKPGIVAARLTDRSHLELTGAEPGETAVSLFLKPARRSGPAVAEQAYAVTVEKSGAAAAQALQSMLRAQPGFASVQVVPAGAGVALMGQVEDVETHERLLRLATAQAGGPVADLVSVTGGQMVAVDIRFYAVASDTLKSLGFNFSYLGGGVQGALSTPGSLQSFSLTPQGLDVQAATPLQDAFNLLLAKPRDGALGMLSALSDAGLSQVLAQPTLLVRSGEQADFLAGGDVPIPVPQGGGVAGAVTIEYRPYGVRLSVAPVVLSNKRILLKLSPEVSELDYTNKVEVQGVGVPGFKRRSTSTTVELGDGQSFVIAGLTYVSGTSNEFRMPGLGDLPVIGALFKTSQVTRERQELIVVATPRLVAPLDHDPLEGVSPEVGTASMGDLVTGRGATPDQLQQLGLSR